MGLGFISDHKVAISLILIISIVAGIGIYAWYNSCVTTYTIQGTVVSKWIDPVKDGSAYLLKVNLTNTHTLKMIEVKRNEFFLHVNEDILYSGIEVNKTYIFTCWGWDMESFLFFSLYWYPNVVNATVIP